MFILLPILTCIIVYLMVFNGLSRKEPVEDALREAVVYSVGAVGLFTVISSELLGVFSSITRLALVILWSGILLALTLITWRKRIFYEAIRSFFAWWKNIRLNEIERIALIATSSYLIILFVIAIISPPNNNDSLQYHLARIVHWIQNRNFGFYPVAYLPQLFNPPGAEILLLHNFLLVGGDQLVNLQQWFFMLASLVAGSFIAKKLGSGRTGEWLTVIFLLTLPSGILEATSTQNDFVVTFWILGTALLVVKNFGRQLPILDVIMLGVLAGLAMLTKYTAYPYVAVILVWAILSSFKMNGLKKSILFSTLIISILFSINITSWLRNLDAFNNPLGESSYVSQHALSARKAADFLISPIQHLSLNFGTPFDALNKKAGDEIIAFCEKLDGSNCSVSDSMEWDFRIIGLSNHEDTAGNFLHLIVFILVIGLLLLNKWRTGDRRDAIGYLLVILISFLLLSWLVAWGAYWSRLQLPFFAMSAAFVGYIVSRWNQRVAYALMIILVFSSLPWLFFNRTRPVVGYYPGVTLVESIFVETRATVLFANYPELEDQIQHVSGEALKTGCPTIKLRIDSRDPEYYFMSFLQPWKTGIWIESVADDTLLDRYTNADIKACAMICSICGFDPDPNGLIFAYKDKAMTLYLSPEYYVEYQKNDI